MADDTHGQYTFRSWLKRGVSGQQQLPDPSKLRASVKLSVEVGSISPPPAVTLFLHGPGDVRGLDQRAVIRTWPRPGARNAEPNYFPLIEFDQPDLPWRYSPEEAKGNKVRPWLCVLVVPTSAAKNFSPPKPGQPLGVLNVSTSLLPDLNESALWAHTQIHGPDFADEAALAQNLVSQRSIFSSRILAVVKLQPETEYAAFLVPTFEAGRRAGLGEDLKGVTGALQAAWDGAKPSVALPVFYYWSFHTGPAGDFKSLVKKLHPLTKPFPETFGKRKMDVSAPGLELPRADDSPMELEGVLLRYPRTARTDWAGAARDAFVQSLTKLLNLPAQLYKAAGEIVVAPPLYGRWHAAREEVTTGSPAWFQELNEDPRQRVFAGAGTLAVQARQQDYLAEAWDQVGDVRKANQSSLWAELAVRLSRRLYQRVFDGEGAGAATPESIVKFTSPVHARVLGSPVTIRRLIEESPIAGGFLEPQFRRIARPLGPLGRRQGRAAGSGVVPGILERMNRGEFSPAPPPPVPHALATPARIADSLVPSWATPGVREFLRALPGWLSALGVLLLLVAVLVLAAGAAATAVVLVVGAAGVAALAAAPLARRLGRNLDARAALRDGKLTAEQIKQLPIPSGYVPAEFTPGDPTPRPVAAAPGAGGATSEAAANFREAASELFAHLNLPPAEPPPLRSVSLLQLKEKLSTALDPNRTVVSAFRSRLALESGTYQVGIDGTGQVMAAPSLKRAMYDELKALSQDWVLPGADEIEANSVSLLTTNQASVEAFMVGVNHEMARTLLFNEYPTDQRGTYFRQFWDSSGAAGQAENPEDFLDIKHIHEWGRARLGQNTSRKPKAKDNDVVLCVRGEVLLRYPETIVYAAKAVRNTSREGRKLVLPRDNDLSAHLTHVFHGEMGADIRFFGFPLDIGEALGEDGGDGWFFVLQQHPGEPVFGLDVGQDLPGEEPRESARFSELIKWKDVLPPAGGGPPSPVTHLSFGASQSAVSAIFKARGPRFPNWGQSSAEVAADTLRQPARVAFHARSLIRR